MIVRPANAEDMDSIYLMGIDVWGEGLSTEEYLASCRDSKKYTLGEWHCLTGGKQIVSSLVVYKNCFGLTDRYVGLGSIATHPDFRRNGYAGTLIQFFIDEAVKGNYFGMFLFSDVEAQYYEKFGFTVVEMRGGSTLMFLSLNGRALPELPCYF